jgi:hypothetical protein
MNNASRIFIIVLIALVAAFVVVFTLGATRDSDEKADLSAASWVETIHGLLVGTQALDVKDVKVADGSSVNCLQGAVFVVPPDGMCVYDIQKASGSSVRNVGLTLQAGQSVEVMLEQEESLTAKKTLTGTQTLKGLSVQQAGGTLSLLCRADEGEKECRLELK